MRIRFILVLLIALFFSMESRAYEGRLEIPEITIPSGSIVDLQIDLIDDELTVGLDGEIDLPDGFTIIPQDDNATRSQYTLNNTRNDKMTFEASYPYQNNDIRFILMTSDLSEIKGKSGWLIKLPMTTTVKPGTYEATMHSIHMSYSYGNSFEEKELPDVKIKITVIEPVEIRYTDNQLFCNDIEIHQGENAELNLSYNSTSEVYEYSADIVLPTRITVDGDVNFSNAVTTVENFTNNYSWDSTASKVTVSGVYGGGRRDLPAPAGIQEVATIKLNTASLIAGEYEIKVTNQMLSNDNDDYTPVEYVGKLIVKAVTSDVDELEIGTNSMLLLQSVGDYIRISGIASNESIALYEISGSLIYQGNANSEIFTIPYACVPGQIYIVKVGKSTHKYLF